MHTTLRLVIGLLFLAVIGCTSSTLVEEGRLADSPEAVNQALNSVVALVERTEEGLSAPQCTAFFIGPRILATAYHCVEQPAFEEVELAPNLVIKVPVSGAVPTIGSEVLFIKNSDHNDFIANYDRKSEPRTHRAFVVEVNPRDDVALLHLTESEEPVADWFPIAEHLPRTGEKIYEIGMPNNQFWLFTEGMVSSIRVFPNGRTAIIHQANVSPGASGGPVFNNFGQVVGVTTSFARGTYYIGFATPISLIRELMQRPIVMPGDPAILTETSRLETSVVCEKSNCSLLDP